MRTIQSIPRPVSWAAEFLFWLIVVGLVAFTWSGCSMLGIATEGYVEDRIQAVDEKVTESAVDVAEPVDNIVPGYKEFVRAKYTGRPVAPPPAPDPAFPWIEVIGIVGAAFGVSVPAAVKATNVIRDRNRRAYGEATNVREAVALGQIPTAKPPEAT